MEIYYTPEVNAIETLTTAHNSLVQNKEVSGYEAQDLRVAIMALAKAIKAKAELAALPEKV